MSELYGRINLSKTNYNVTLEYKVLQHPDVERISNIYRDYCLYKQFESVYPLFPSEWNKPHMDLIGYWHNHQLVAFSMYHKYDNKNVHADQFAWDYKNPALKIGYKSLRTECALYKAWGYDYIYIGEHYEYKSEIQGYEILGPMT